MVGKPFGFSLCRFSERLEQAHCTLRTNGKHTPLQRHAAALLIVGLALLTGVIIVPRGLWSLGFALLILATIPLCYAGSHANYPAKGDYTLLMMLWTVLRRYPRQFVPRLNSTALSVGQGTGVLFEKASVRLAQEVTRTMPQLGTGLEGKAAQTFGVTSEARKRFDVPIQQSLQEVGKGDRPIVDRANGDIEPDQSNWDLEIIGEATPWVRYKGHWGRWVLWPGERSPGGPMYSQGKVRLAWRDPFRWAGLPA